MNVGIYGNENNAGALFAEGLRALGHEPKLVVTRKEMLHRPEACVAEYDDGYPDWIMDASDFEFDDYACLHPRIHPALNFLAGSDFLILNHYGPSLASLWERPYICVLTGSDLTYLASFQTTATRSEAWDAPFRRSPGARLTQRHAVDLFRRQREGVGGAELVMFPQRGLVPEGDAILDELGVDETRRTFALASFSRWLPEPAARPGTGGPMKILCGTRVNWKLPMPPTFCSQDNKGLDVLLKGVGEFLRSVPDADVRLQLIEKGLHMAETKELATELGIEKVIEWKPEMPLRDFLREVVDADVIVDHFGPAMPGLCAWNGMAAGKPVMADFHRETLEGYFGEPIPGCDASSAREVAEWLRQLWEDEGLRVDMGARAKAFADRHLSIEKHLEAILERVCN